MSITLSVTNGVGTPTFSRIGFMNSVAGKILAVWTAGIRELADNPAVKTRYCTVPAGHSVRVWI